MNLVDFVLDSCASGDVTVTDDMLSWLSPNLTETVQNEFVLFCANNHLLPSITAYENSVLAPPTLLPATPVTGDSIMCVLQILARKNPVFTSFVDKVSRRLLG